MMRIFNYFLITIFIISGLILTQSCKDNQHADDIIIADFEQDGYEGWIVEGEAFGSSPKWLETEAFEEISGFEGKGLATSYQQWDEPTGTLTSPEIIIEKNYISFLISGGEHVDQTCMHLIADGKNVRTATGNNSNTMDWISWDVSALKGKKVQIKIVDQHIDDWGHISVDHIVQSDDKIEMLENATRKFTFRKKYLNFPVSREAVQTSSLVLAL